MSIVIRLIILIPLLAYMYSVLLTDTMLDSCPGAVILEVSEKILNLNTLPSAYLPVQDKITNSYAILYTTSFNY